MSEGLVRTDDRDVTLLGPDALDAAVKEVLAAGDALVLRLGRLLQQIQLTGAYVVLGFDTFDHYLDARFDRGRRWAQQRMQIARVVDKHPPLAERAADLGATRLRLLAPAVEAGVAVGPEVLERASQQSTREVAIWVREQMAGRPVPDPELAPWTVRVAKDQREVIDRAMEVASRMTDSHAKGYLLEMVCADFLSTYEEPEAAGRMPAILRTIIVAALEGPGAPDLLREARWAISEQDGLQRATRRPT